MPHDPSEHVKAMLEARGLDVEAVRDSLRLDVDRLLASLQRVQPPHLIPCDRGTNCPVCKDPELRADADYLNAA
jgi:hypothetical protein